MLLLLQYCCCWIGCALSHLLQFLICFLRRGGVLYCFILCPTKADCCAYSSRGAGKSMAVPAPSDHRWQIRRKQHEQPPVVARKKVKSHGGSGPRRTIAVGNKRYFFPFNVDCCLFCSGEGLEADAVPGCRRILTHRPSSMARRHRPMQRARAHHCHWQWSTADTHLRCSGSKRCDHYPVDSIPGFGGVGGRRAG